jgi:hypothetical protein
MQVNVENAFNSISQVVIFKELCDVGGALANIIPFNTLFCYAHFSF